jgi:hypothetical protein
VIKKGLELVSTKGETNPSLVKEEAMGPTHASERGVIIEDVMILVNSNLSSARDT